MCVEFYLSGVEKNGLTDCIIKRKSLFLNFVKHFMTYYIQVIIEYGHIFAHF